MRRIVPVLAVAAVVVSVLAEVTTKGVTKGVPKVVAMIEEWNIVDNVVKGIEGWDMFEIGQKAIEPFTGQYTCNKFSPPDSKAHVSYLGSYYYELLWGYSCVKNNPYSVGHNSWPDYWSLYK